MYISTTPARRHHHRPLHVALTNIYIRVHAHTDTHAHSDTYNLVQKGTTPLWIATSNGHIEAVKELICAGCDMNRAETVEQMTRLALALARSVPFARLPLPPPANLNLQYLLRLLLES